MTDEKLQTPAPLEPTWVDDDRDERPTSTTRRFSVVWQAEDRSFHTVGTLEVDQDDDHAVLASRFWYAPDVATVPGFQPFAAFPAFPPTSLIEDGTETRWQWESRDGLLSMFRNRVLSPRRPDFVTYAEALGLGDGADPVELLARTGGGRATDTLHLVPEPLENEDGTQEMLFLVSGVRHVDPDGEAATTLRPGDALKMRPEPDNDYNPRALLLDTSTGRPLGYVPNYLVDRVHKHLEAGGSVEVRAEHINGTSTPAHLRLLARLSFLATADKQPVDTVPAGGVWANKPAGSKRASKTISTKAETVGRATTQQVRNEHISDQRDGTIDEGRSYGSDPFLPRD